MYKYKFFLTASIISLQFTHAYADEISKEKIIINNGVQETETPIHEKKEEFKDKSPNSSTPTQSSDTSTDELKQKNINSDEIINYENNTINEENENLESNTVQKNEPNITNDEKDKLKDKFIEHQKSIPDVDPLTLNIKKPEAREIYDVTFNNNYLVNALTFIFKDNHLLIEKKYLISMLNELENPVFHTINKKEYFYIPAKFVTQINNEKLAIDISLSP